VSARRKPRIGDDDPRHVDALVLRKTTAPEALMSGALKVDGDPSKFALLFGMLDQPGTLMFDILTRVKGANALT